MLFDDIKGQDKAIGILREDARNRHLAGAYLFCGPEGIGKFLAAKTFASALNCLNQTLRPCNDCLSCRKIQNSQHPDVHLIDNGYTEEIKIEQVRQLQQEISLKPYEAATKVFIINDAHNLNLVSANAFLKTLEEPPKDSLIILVSDKPQVLLKTIISRTRRIKFAPLARAEISMVLKDRYKVDELTQRYLSYFCEGRLGAALRLKDTDIIVSKNRVIDSFTSNSNGWRINSLVQDRDELRNSLQVLAGWFRDIYLLKVGLPDDQMINFDRRDAAKKMLDRYTFSELDEAINVISDSLLFLERNVNLKLLVSNLMLSLNKANN